MATLVFSAVGTALAGPLGGAIGALAGRQIDSALFGPGSRSGPRLRELEVSLSSYGTAIPRLHGRMRVAGAIIWATELQEHSELRGTGKGTPAVTTYSYTANLAVALSSRPIQDIGRVWADGKLLRGAAGDLKAGGQMRIHRGGEDQAVDPLIAASEGEDRCPAFRGLAYVVFEALDLTDFGNRVPALTFEVVADDTVTLRDMLGDSLPGIAVPNEVSGLAGFAVEDSLDASLAALAPAIPIALDGAGETIVAHLTDRLTTPVLLGEPAISVKDDAFGGASGSQRRRTPAEVQPPPVLRYFDLTRDFLPGTQHAGGRAHGGQPDVVELPAALDPATAKMLVERMARRRDRARERVAWRTATLDSTVAPGVVVRLPDRPGIWQVESWEWREAGVELELVRVAAAVAPSAPSLPAPSFPAPVDLPPATTRLVACELPWDAASGAADRPRLAAAVSADGANWSGAALYADHGDGQLWPLGPATRTRAVIGTTSTALGPASPLLIDRGNALVVTLAARDLALTSASLADLAAGANLALVGEELIQFACAEAMGNGQWCLTDLLRGRGGTEQAIVAHEPGEGFALLDGKFTTLDLVATDATTIVALGRGDSEPVSANVQLTGVALRPLAPVHGRVIATPDGGLHLGWARRARGDWSWRDGVDVPFAEESERYLVTYESGAAPVRAWTVENATLNLLPDDLRDLPPNGAFLVRQQGTHGLSHPHRLVPPS